MLIDFSFNGVEHTFITFSKFGGGQFKEASDHKICFNRQKMKMMYIFYKTAFLPLG